MFGTLVESQRARVRRTGGTAVSLLVHSALITGAVSATATRVAHANGDSPEPRIAYYRPLPAPVARPQPRRIVTPTAQAGSSNTTAPEVPRVDLHTIPTTLPPIDAPLGDVLRRVETPAEPMLTGKLGALPTGDRAWGAADVEHAARLLNRVIPAYPRALAASGLEGRVVVRFVVDTLGRVEAGSVEVLESEHPLFERAAREALARMRFAPATVGGARVRMAAELPFVFALQR